MPLTLANSHAIETGLFVRIDVEYYKSSPSAAPTHEILRFSDYKSSVTINGETYLGLGGLVGIGPSVSELKASSGSLTITISGIPNTSIAEIVNSRIKGSPVEVYRTLLVPNATGQAPSVALDPVGRFFGIVDNYSLEESYDIEARTSSNTICLICSSNIDRLSNKVAGRKANPRSMKNFYSTDLSFDRVPSLVGSNFNFGAPQ